jgi:hypothetical protein
MAIGQWTAQAQPFAAALQAQGHSALRQALVDIPQSEVDATDSGASRVMIPGVIHGR